MDVDTLQGLLAQFGAMRNGNSYLAPCPLCQSVEEDREKWKLNLAPGGIYPLLTFCHKCCEKDNPTRNHKYFSEVCNLVGVDSGLLREKMDSGKIRLLWSQLGVLTSDSRPLPAESSLLHAVYSDLLNELELTEPHRKWLERRGLDSEWAYGAGYRSTPEDSSGLCTLLWGTWNFKLATVPGFKSVFDSVSTRVLLRFPAILIPCRNTEGQILAIKQRIMDGGPGRMRLLGNSRDGGPKAVTLTHIPLGVGGHKWKELWVTEGERKADVHWVQTGLPTVGIPGTGNWGSAATVIASLLESAGVLIVAMDKDGKDSTLRAERELVKMGKEKGLKVQIAKWDKGKGLDDALRMGVSIKVEEAGEYNQSLPYPSDPHPLCNGLKDWEILPYVKDNSPIPRINIPLRHPNQDRLLSEWIKLGRLAIKEKGPKGQILEFVK